MPSRSLEHYKTRIRDITSYLEAVDAGLVTVARIVASHTNAELPLAVSLNLSVKAYPSLRIPAKQSVALFNRTRRHNAEYALIALYSRFGEYCKNILKDIYASKPLIIVGKAPGALQYQEIVRLGSFEAVADFMVEQVFRKLENIRSTTKRLDSLLDGTGVSISKDILHDAMMFFEIRHLLVHRSGLIDRDFMNSYSSAVGTPIKINGRLPTTVGFALKGIRSVSKLVEELDLQLISAGLIASN